MNKIIKELNNLYIWNNKIKFYESRNINVLAHKDRVWFFVVNNKNNNQYVLYIYWNIKKEDILWLKKVFSKKVWYISVKVININEKYVTINSDKTLDTEDFLMYVPNFYIKNWWLFWPYLDNLLSILILNKIHHKFKLWQSIDEESKLIYSNFPKKWTTIVLDVLWQDYIKEKINLDKIYSITSTSFTDNLLVVTWEDIENIDINLKFKLEIDFIKHSKKYFLLCPIINWHSDIASVKLSTLDKFEKTLNLLFNKIAWKKF